jgi:hypothetical protein
VLEAAVVFKPETLVRWHRSGFRLYWRCKSRPRVGRTAVPADIRALIQSRSVKQEPRRRHRCRGGGLFPPQHELQRHCAANSTRYRRSGLAAVSDVRGMSLPYSSVFACWLRI